MWQVEIELGGYGLDEAWLRRLTERVLAEKGVSPRVGVSIALRDEAEMVALNQKYLGRPGVTDVLAFPLGAGDGFVSPPDDITYLGEVVLCYPQAVRQAQEWGHEVNQEVALLLIHGLLHLLGFDDGDELAAQQMRQEETRLLNLFPELGAGV